MTRAHRILMQWAEQSGIKDYELIDLEHIRIGESTFGMNLYCDIMDMETLEIVATSDLVHDWEKLEPHDVPTSWISVGENTNG